jgi:hypothetical protein
VLRAVSETQEMHTALRYETSWKRTSWKKEEEMDKTSNSQMDFTHTSFIQSIVWNEYLFYSAKYSGTDT